MSLKVICALVAVFIGHISAGTVTAGNPCSETSDCVPNMGYVCTRYWETCAKGICQCPTGQSATTNGKCETSTVTSGAVWLGDSCAEDSRIQIENAVCDATSKTVVCETTGVKQTGTICKKETGEKILGEQCASTDKCIGYGTQVYQADSTILSCNSASPSVCECASTYIQAAGTSYCRQKTVGDACASGECAKSNQECSADKKCACQADYTEAAGECIVQGPLPEGAACKYTSSTVLSVSLKDDACVAGLSCETCPGESSKKCLKPSSGSAMSPTLFHLTCAVVLSTVGRQMV